MISRKCAATVLIVASVVILCIAATTTIDILTQVKSLPVVYAKQSVATGGCGLAMDGATDDSTALNACIASAGASGKHIIFGPGDVLLNSGVLVAKSNIWLDGSGGFGTTCIGSGGGVQSFCRPATRFIYGGSGGTGTYVLKIDGSGTAVKSVNGVHISGIGLDANNLANMALWVYNTGASVFENMDLKDWQGTTATRYSRYGWVIDGNGQANAPLVCGYGSGFLIFNNIYAEVVLNSNSAGLVLGPSSGFSGPGGQANDVCSIRFDNIFMTIRHTPGIHGIWVAGSDSNVWGKIHVIDFLGEVNVTSAVATSTTSARVFAPSHGLPAGTANDGGYIDVACSVPLSGTTCSGTRTGPLEGSVNITYVDADHIDVNNLTCCLTNGATYYAHQIAGADVELGDPAGTNLGAWDNSFLNLIVFGVHQAPGSNSNPIAQYNWIESTLGTLDASYRKVANASAYPVVWNGIDGSVAGSRLQGQTLVDPYYGTRSLLFTGQFQDFGVGIDFSGVPNTTIPTNAGYSPMLLRSNTVINFYDGTSTFQLIGSDSSNNIVIAGPFGAAVPLVRIYKPTVLPNGSGALRMIRNDGTSTLNVMSVTGAGDSLNLGSIGQMNFYNGSGFMFAANSSFVGTGNRHVCAAADGTIYAGTTSGC